MNCTINGDIIEKILVEQFVIPIKIPEWLGDKSTWLTWKPQNPPAVMAPFRINRATERPDFSLGIKPISVRFIPGNIVPKTEYIINSFTWLSYCTAKSIVN